MPVTSSRRTERRPVRGARLARHARRARRARPPRLDTGSATVEIVVLLPTVMLMFALAMQLALWGLGSHALSAAVAEAGAAATAVNASTSQAAALVAEDARNFGGGFLVDPRITAQGESNGFVAIQASAEVPSLVPGLDLVVRATSDGPAQLFRASG